MNGIVKENFDIYFEGRQSVRVCSPDRKISRDVSVGRHCDNSSFMAPLPGHLLGPQPGLSLLL